ncbi:MAG: hypothetical protein ACOX4I_00670 [Anaerovoracaceae bacterium]|jgi:hemerythrin-like domain-containing protein
MKGKTSTGFEYDINEMVINNMEFLEELASYLDGEGFEIFHVIEEVLGKDGKKALYEHVRDKSGKVPVDKINEELAEIFTALSGDEETKNS